MLNNPTKQVIVAALLAAATSTALIAQCTNPPTNSGIGARPGYVFRYAFIGSVAQQACIEQAFQLWTLKNAQSGGNCVSYQPVQSGQSPNITITMQNLGSSNAAGITAPTRDSAGYITGYGMQFNTNTNLIESCEGFLKAALHEIGHGQNLADASGSGGSSVMNQFSGKDDSGGNLPTEVTDCDKVTAASESPTPPGGGGDPDPCEGADDTTEWGCVCLGFTWELRYEDSPWCNPESPLLIDLESPDVHYSLTSADQGVSFDFSGDGTPERVSWTRAGSQVGFIVWDRNGNGTIDNGAELFGNRTRKRDGTLARHAYEALADLDDSQDGQVSAADSVFSSLRLWIDGNHNGVSEASELSNMSEAGIMRLFTEFTVLGRRDQHGNLYTYGGTAAVIGSNGTEVRRRTFDVFFKIAR